MDLKRLAFLLLCFSTPLRAENSDTQRALLGIDSYHAWIQTSLKAIEADLPAITTSAEAAAKAYLQDDWQIVASGDFGVVGEAVGRSGGMMRFRWGSPIKDYVKGPGGRVVFLALREDNYEDYLAQALKTFSTDSAFVVLMGPRKLLDRAKADGFPMAAAIENHSTPGEGLFADGEGVSVVATSPVANVPTLWAWTAEFVSACTREGKMPVMYQSYAVPGAKERAERLKDIRFEEAVPPPIPAGVLGRSFLQAAAAGMETFYQNERTNLAAVAVKAFETKKAGQVVYAFLHGHSIGMQQLAVPGSPNFFTQVNSGWFEQNKKITLEKGDFVFCVGYAARFHDNEYKQWDVTARQSGATLAWSFTDYQKDDVEAVKAAGELWVNQHWAYGDAVVVVPGLDFKLFPTSGLIAQAVIRLVEAGIYGLNQPADWKP